MNGANDEKGSGDESEKENIFTPVFHPHPENVVQVEPRASPVKLQQPEIPSCLGDTILIKKEPQAEKETINYLVSNDDNDIIIIEDDEEDKEIDAHENSDGAKTLLNEMLGHHAEDEHTKSLQESFFVKINHLNCVAGNASSRKEQLVINVPESTQGIYCNDDCYEIELLPEDANTQKDISYEADDETSYDRKSYLRCNRCRKKIYFPNHNRIRHTYSTEQNLDGRDTAFEMEDFQFKCGEYLCERCLEDHSCRRLSYAIDKSGHSECKITRCSVCIDIAKQLQIGQGQETYYHRRLPSSISSPLQEHSPNSRKVKKYGAYNEFNQPLSSELKSKDPRYSSQMLSSKENIFQNIKGKSAECGDVIAMQVPVPKGMHNTWYSSLTSNTERGKMKDKWQNDSSLDERRLAYHNEHKRTATNNYRSYRSTSSEETNQSGVSAERNRYCSSFGRIKTAITICPVTGNLKQKASPTSEEYSFVNSTPNQSEAGVCKYPTF